MTQLHYVFQLGDSSTATFLSLLHTKILAGLISGWGQDRHTYMRNSIFSICTGHRMINVPRNTPFAQFFGAQSIFNAKIHSLRTPLGSLIKSLHCEMQYFLKCPLLYTAHFGKCIVVFHEYRLFYMYAVPEFRACYRKSFVSSMF